MNFVLNLVFQFYLVMFGNKFTYYNQMLWSIIIIIFSLTGLVFTTIFVKGLVGFMMACFFLLIQGFTNSILQSSLFGLAGFMPFKFIIGVSLGNGFGGLLLNLVRYLTIIIFGIDNVTESAIIWGSVIFFSVANLLLLIAMVLLIVFIIYYNNIIIRCFITSLISCLWLKTQATSHKKQSTRCSLIAI